MSASPRRTVGCTSPTRPSPTDSTACLHPVTPLNNGEVKPIRQLWVCDDAPAQVPHVPPPHVRDWDCAPQPQLLEHVPHAPQLDHAFGVAARSERGHQQRNSKRPTQVMEREPVLWWWWCVALPKKSSPLSSSLVQICVCVMAMVCPHATVGHAGPQLVHPGVWRERPVFSSSSSFARQAAANSSTSSAQDGIAPA